MAHAAKEGEESMAAVVAAPLTYCRGAYSPEHSFFEGYEWCFCSCLNCGAFLGWGFAHKDRLTCYRQANRERTTTSEKRDVLPSQVTPDFSVLSLQSVPVTPSTVPIDFISLCAALPNGTNGERQSNS
ncbi:hypothetical protein AGDE_07881 [Angomonas deanei]|uniref:CULT domain-containing protein n=1 Tax=Angomonas deanei TaxID=59799 RepID=A0A7G2CHB1_9TRYP|nr:hypothetical protein AGDE_07881 [Angomonas deanei]CAD2219258.1 hypothetical protein, conserved [Angomonas deanei]|eukprot:EPY34504.1 hypothetical protein AGDE_07881 [Angomonas deanei]